MASFLAEPFLRKFPDNVRKSLSDPESLYLIIYDRIRNGSMPVVTLRQSFINFMQDLKKKDPEIYSCLTSLYEGKKLGMLENSNGISDALSNLTIRKSVLNEITPAANNSINTIFYDEFENKKWQEWLITALNKPLFLERQIIEGEIEFLFKNQFTNLKPGETFSIESTFSKLRLPFKKIRILDPYLYDNINHIPLYRIIKSITKKIQSVDVEIISSLEPDRSANPEKIKLDLMNHFSSYDIKGVNITLRSQRRSGKDVFHRRVIWTDFWCLKSDQSFNFLNTNSDYKKVKMENDLNVAGKYSSKESIWHKINNDWEVYQYYSETFQKHDL